MRYVFKIAVCFHIAGPRNPVQFLAQNAAPFLFVRLLEKVTKPSRQLALWRNQRLSDITTLVGESWSVPACNVASTLFCIVDVLGKATDKTVIFVQPRQLLPVDLASQTLMAKAGTRNVTTAGAAPLLVVLPSQAACVLVKRARHGATPPHLSLL